MLFRKVITLYTCLHLFSFVVGQNQKTLLLYTEEHDYLVPTIEDILSKIKNTNTEELILSEIANLNRINNNLADEVYLRDVIDNYSNKTFQSSSEAELAQSNLENILINYDYFLRIKINVLQDLIEYQMFLYGRTPKNTIEQDSSMAEFPSIDITSPIKTANFFIEPSSKSYVFELQNKIQSLFPISNHTPGLDIFINNKSYNKKDTLYFTFRDLVNLDVNITDKDTPKKRLNLSLRQIDIEGNVEVPNDLKIRLEKNRLSQELKFNKLGYYLFGVTASDGIANSLEDTIQIHIIPVPPILEFDNREVIFYAEKGVFKKTNFESSYVPFFAQKLEQFSNFEINVTSLDSGEDVNFFIGNAEKKDSMLLHKRTSRVFFANLFGIDKNKFSVNIFSTASTKPSTDKYGITLVDRGVEGDQAELIIHRRVTTSLNIACYNEFVYPRWSYLENLVLLSPEYKIDSIALSHYLPSISLQNGDFEVGYRVRLDKSIHINSRYSFDYGNSFFLSVRSFHRNGSGYSGIIFELFRYNLYESGKRIEKKRRLSGGVFFNYRLFDLPFYLDFSIRGIPEISFLNNRISLGSALYFQNNYIPRLRVGIIYNVGGS